MEIVVTGSGEDDELAALVNQARTGNTAAFDELARRVRARVRRWARVLVGDGGEAEDVTQVVLVRVHERLAEFEGRSRFASWLYRITRNSDVARHVRECARCQGVARQLLRDTRALAVPEAHTITLGRSAPRADHPPLSRRTSVRRVTVAVSVAACGVWLLRGLGWDPMTAGNATRAPLAPAPMVVATASDSTGAGERSRAPNDARATRGSRVEPPRSIRRPTRTHPTGRMLAAPHRGPGYTEPAVVVRAVSVSPVEPLRAVEASRLDPAAEQPLSSCVAVEPPLGTRATLIRTPDPNVTVVWLSR